MMKKSVCGIALLLLPLWAWAASGPSIPLDKAPIHPNDKASLQRGAKVYMNYCAGCHSLKYLRYNKLGQDLGIVDEMGRPDEKMLKENLIFTDSKTGEKVEIAMSPAEAEKWFGVTPPDLSLIARVRGVDWLYTYLRSFYLDPAKPMGVNNLLFPDVAMPNVLQNLQGLQMPVYYTERVNKGGKSELVYVLDHLKVVAPGELSPEKFNRLVADLVNFMGYVAEPYRAERIRLGWWVMGFLLVFLILVYFLKKEYWQDVPKRLFKK